MRGSRDSERQTRERERGYLVLLLPAAAAELGLPFHVLWSMAALATTRRFGKKKNKLTGKNLTTDTADLRGQN